MLELDNLPIRVVCATRKPQKLFLSHTATGRSIKSFIDVSNVQVRLFAENSIGLPELYNKAIEETKNNPAILVFMHDDVLITDFFWASRVRAGLKKFDIVGLAGNKRRIKNQCGWRTIDLEGNLDVNENLSGAIGHGKNFPPSSVHSFGPANTECKLLDGLFIACASPTLLSSSISFDKQFSFHFYDLDFCRTAEQKNLKMGTIPLAVLHESIGNFDQSWYQAYQAYLRKWSE